MTIQALFQGEDGFFVVIPCTDFIRWRTRILFTGTRTSKCLFNRINGNNYFVCPSDASTYEHNKTREEVES